MTNRESSREKNNSDDIYLLDMHKRALKTCITRVEYIAHRQWSIHLQSLPRSLAKITSATRGLQIAEWSAAARPMADVMSAFESISRNGAQALISTFNPIHSKELHIRLLNKAISLVSCLVRIVLYEQKYDSMENLHPYFRIGANLLKNADYFEKILEFDPLNSSEDTKCVIYLKFISDLADLIQTDDVRKHAYHLRRMEKKNHASLVEYTYNLINVYGEVSLMTASLFFSREVGRNPMHMSMSSYFNYMENEEYRIAHDNKNYSHHSSWDYLEKLSQIPSIGNLPDRFIRILKREIIFNDLVGHITHCFHTDLNGYVFNIILFSKNSGNIKVRENFVREAWKKCTNNHGHVIFDEHGGARPIPYKNSTINAVTDRSRVILSLIDWLTIGNYYLPFYWQQEGRRVLRTGITEKFNVHYVLKNYTLKPLEESMSLFTGSNSAGRKLTKQEKKIMRIELQLEQNFSKQDLCYPVPLPTNYRARGQ